MSKKLKFILILLLIISIIGLISGIRAIRNYCILNSIINKLESNIEKNNYSLKSTAKVGDNVSTTIAYYKDGIGKLVSSDGVYSWVDGKSAYLVDEENKNIYVMEISAENSALLVSENMFMSSVPGYSKNSLEKFFIAGSFNNKFSSDKINDEKCYKIKTLEGKDGKTIKTLWVTKSRGFPIKSTLEFPNGEVLEYEYDLKFFTTKLSDVELPDLSEYTYYDYLTKIKIEKPNVY